MGERGYPKMNRLEEIVEKALEEIDAYEFAFYYVPKGAMRRIIERALKTLLESEKEGLDVYTE